MAKQEVVTFEVTLRPGASPPRVTGARFVKVHRGERDPLLKRFYLAYVPADQVRAVEPKITGHPAVESAKRIPPRGISPIIR